MDFYVCNKHMNLNLNLETMRTAFILYTVIITFA